MERSGAKARCATQEAFNGPAGVAIRYRVVAARNVTIKLDLHYNGRICLPDDVARSILARLTLNDAREYTYNIYVSTAVHYRVNTRVGRGLGLENNGIVMEKPMKSQSASLCENRRSFSIKAVYNDAPWHIVDRKMQTCKK